MTLILIIEVSIHAIEVTVTEQSAGVLKMYIIKPESPRKKCLEAEVASAT